MKLGSLNGLKVLALYFPSRTQTGPKIEVHVSDELPEETQALIRAEIKKALNTPRNRERRH